MAQLQERRQSSGSQAQSVASPSSQASHGTAMTQGSVRDGCIAPRGSLASAMVDRPSSPSSLARASASSFEAAPAPGARAPAPSVAGSEPALAPGPWHQRSSMALQLQATAAKGLRRALMQAERRSLHSALLAI